MDKKPYDIDEALEQQPGRRRGKDAAPESFGGAVTRELSRAAAASEAAERHRGGERWSWQLGLRVVLIRLCALLWLVTALFIANEFLQADAEVLRSGQDRVAQGTLLLGGRMLLAIALTVVVALVAWQALQMERWAARLLQAVSAAALPWWWWLNSSHYWPAPVPGTEAIAAAVFGWWLPVLAVAAIVVIALGGSALSE